MRYLTKEWYNLCQQPRTEENARMIEKAVRERAAEMDKAELPADLRKKFFFHDEIVKNCTADGEKLTLVLGRGKHQAGKITFVGANVKSKEGLPTDGEWIWLYEELFRAWEGYEAHILFEKQRGLDLLELTVRCRGIVIE